MLVCSQLSRPFKLSMNERKWPRRRSTKPWRSFYGAEVHTVKFRLTWIFISVSGSLMSSFNRAKSEFEEGPPFAFYNPQVRCIFCLHCYPNIKANLLLFNAVILVCGISFFLAGAFSVFLRATTILLFFSSIGYCLFSRREYEAKRWNGDSSRVLFSSAHSYHWRPIWDFRLLFHVGFCFGNI